MFFIVCASTSRSSVRVGCAGPLEAWAKMLELEESGIGKVRAFDAAGNRVMAEQLAALANAAAEAPSRQTPVAVRALVAETLCGSDMDVDARALSLHDVTQLAAALRPGAVLKVRNSGTLSPIEQASIASVMPGQVHFV